MPLLKLPIVTITPAVAAVAGHAASLVCTTAPPETDTGGETGGDSGGPSTPGADTIYLYVPNDPNNPAAGEVVYYGPAPPPAGYVCSLERILVPDPSFPGGSVFVERTNCYWTYP